MSDIVERLRHGIRAFDLAGFCAAYGISKTTAYNEIKAGRLRRRKLGRRTLILMEDAKDWAENLPTVMGKFMGKNGVGQPPQGKSRA